MGRGLVEPRSAHVDLRPEPEPGRTVVAVEVEDHSLALAQHAEHRPDEGVGRQVVLGAIEVADHGADAGPGVVTLDHALHIDLGHIDLGDIDTGTSSSTLAYARGHARYRSVSLTGHLERAAIEALRARLPGPPSGEVWIGDDAAVVAWDGQTQLLAADVVVEEVHFDLALVGIDDVGWKAMAVNVSDIAAMGGVPRHALVSVVVPAGADVDRLYDGLTAAADEYGCAIVGGDLSAGERLVVSVAVTGSVDGAPVLRSGARADDTLVVTGPLGAAAAALESRPVGDAHRRPRARLAEGREARDAGASAMMDLSDGLLLDVRRLAAASGVGVVVADVPVADGATMQQALGGGEDYELLVAIDDPTRLPGWVAIGRCTGDPDELRLGDGDLPEGGWEHTW